jgi:hypothetical protein
LQEAGAKWGGGKKRKKRAVKEVSLLADMESPKRRRG